MWKITLHAILFALLAVRTSAQPGITVCACQPEFYELTLDLDIFLNAQNQCTNTTITDQIPGIIEVACKVTPKSDSNVTDLTPFSVIEVKIAELDQNGAIQTETTIPGPFFQGDSFNYTSVIADPASINSTLYVPKGFQISLTGLNADEEEIENFWIVRYSNDCGFFPLLVVGDYIGWTIFSGVTQPSVDICSAATPQPSSDAPSMVPTITPMPSTLMPSILPTFETSAPTKVSSPTCPPVGPKGRYLADMREHGRNLKVGPTTLAPTACPEPEDMGIADGGQMTTINSRKKKKKNPSGSSKAMGKSKYSSSKSKMAKAPRSSKLSKGGKGSSKTSKSTQNSKSSKRGMNVMSGMSHKRSRERRLGRVNQLSGWHY